MFVESLLDTPDADTLDRGKLLENLLTISQTGTPVIQERTEYPCPLCRGTFRALGDLVMHECPKEKPSQPLLTCCFCSFATEQTSIFRDHLDLHTKPSLRCGHCNHTFPTEAVLLRHLQLHGSSLPLQPFMGTHIQYPLYLPPQMTALLANNNGTLCVVDAPTFMVEVPQDQHSRYTCTLCNAMFHRLSLLAEHGLKHSEFPDIHIQDNFLLPGRGSQEPLGALMCCQCRVVFTHPVALAAHSCDSKVDSSGPSLVSPMVTLAPLLEQLQQQPQQQQQQLLPAAQNSVRLYTCPYCPYTSYLLASLIRHKEIHFTHRCTECSVRFPTLPALIQHKQKMHPNMVSATLVSSPPAPPPVQSVNINGPHKRGRPRKTNSETVLAKAKYLWHCKTCGVGLPRGSAEAISHKCKMFQCPHCKFMTHKPNGLGIHINFAHTFRCQRCGQSFVTKEERVVHTTYMCPNRPFKNVSEEDIPLAVLKRLSELNSKRHAENPSNCSSGQPSEPQHGSHPEASEEEVVFRKRGRPPKYRLQEALLASQASQAEPKAVARKRGRPRGRRKQEA
uniref:Putative chorion transcription factor cf2 n=1 Tax=Amblyomma aureolatum TaxID=187763 RepID=A0A1E1XC08_9ACAR